MGKLTNQVVVVTGGASGIGLATCRRFAREGAKIGMLDLDDDTIVAQCAELRAQGVEVLGLRCDVSVEAECQATCLTASVWQRHFRSRTAWRSPHRLSTSSMTTNWSRCCQSAAYIPKAVAFPSIQHA